MEKERAVTENDNNFSQKKEHRKKWHKFLVTELLLDFSKNTTLHGLRYVTQIGLSTVEKIFWFLMFVISVVLCFVLIRQVWFKWYDTPDIVTINERMIPVEEVPFPSVTICPQMKNKKSELELTKHSLKYRPYIYVYAENNDNSLNDTVKSELKMLDDAALVCNAHFYSWRRNLTDESTIHNILKIAPTEHDTIRLMQWREIFYSGSELFNKVITSEGVCFTFNTLPQEDMFKIESIQNEYQYIYGQSPPTTKYRFNQWMAVDSVEETVYPRRGQECGASPDLVVTLKQNISEHDELCNSLYNGYKVYLHHPDDMPQSSLYYYPVLHGQVTSLALKLSVMSTSESLMKRPPELRHCYSHNDFQLRYFKKYTFNNCKLECLSMYTYKKCGCVSFHMPHWNSSEICPAQRKHCAIRAQNEARKPKELQLTMGDVCNCLPSCHSVKYEADILKTNFEWQKYAKIMFGHEENGFNFSRLEVYFKEPQFALVRRSEMFGLADVLANCGGLLGLFLGFSFLSIIEVFYFCTIRLWYALKRDTKAEKKPCEKVSA